MRTRLRDLAEGIMARCEEVARHSEEPGRISRPFPSESMRRVHECVGAWMQAAGMQVRVDAIGNLIGRRPAGSGGAGVFIIGSHLDSVPDAGRYDGVLGVLLGVAAVQALGKAHLPFAVEVVGFCEEEGIRFRTPYLGSLAMAGKFDALLLERTDAAGISLAAALEIFGLDPARLSEAAHTPGEVLGYIEAHIEQGPVLESNNHALGVVEAIAGQSRLWLGFEGQAGHAGTMPMDTRRDALAAGAEFVLAVETLAQGHPGLRATVGSLTVAPGAVNVIPGSVRLSLDVRHADDAIRAGAIRELARLADSIASRRRLTLHVEHRSDHAAVHSDPRLTNLLVDAARAAGHEPLRMISGAGHDAAVMASLAPMAMLFVRSPGGISHHPDEAVHPADVAAALETMVTFVERLAKEGA